MYGHGGDPFPDEIENLELHADVKSGMKSGHVESEDEDDDDDFSDAQSSASGKGSRSAKSAKSAMTAMSGTSAGSAADDARSVAAIEGRSMPVGTRGVCICWGSNAHGQLGLARAQANGATGLASLSMAFKKMVKSMQNQTSESNRDPIKPMSDKVAVSPTPLYGVSTAINVPSVLSVRISSL
jgi:hypothetical protein